MEVDETAEIAKLKAEIEQLRDALINTLYEKRQADLRYSSARLKAEIAAARRQALEEALSAAELAAETVGKARPESWEVPLVVKTMRELIDAKEQRG